MPTYAIKTWGDYKFGVVPYHDKDVGYLRELFWYHVMPFFYGPRAFDLVVKMPRKKAKTIGRLNYRWMLLNSDGSTNQSGEGQMTLTDTDGFGGRKVKDGDTTHYQRFHNLDWKMTTFRKIKTIDLGWLSKLQQYKIIVELVGASESSGLITMLEFTLKDRDDFQLNLLNVLIGGVIGLVGGAIAGAIVAWLTT